MENQRPIIGILCIDVADKLVELFGRKVKSYIAASYVKFVECGASRVVPIWINRDEQYYRDVMQKINGILLPGGAVFFNSKHIKKPEQTNHCVKSAETIIRIAREMNDNGIYFPVYGICLGYELLLYHSAGGNEKVRQDCTKFNKSMPLELLSDFKSSRLFKDLPTDLEYILQNEAIAFHFHQYCITREDLQLFKIVDQWRATSVNQDDNGLEFISTIEHTKYPFYGFQFHPEKISFEWTQSDSISHTQNAMKCSQYFGNFFISECRKNSNHFPDEMEACRHLIYNFRVFFTGMLDVKWDQCYLFDEKSDYPEGKDMQLGKGRDADGKN